MARVVLGMSGGVDSSVAGLLLKEQGHEVIGLFMRNWNDASVTLEDECPWIDDSRDAMMVAEQLGIPFQVLDLSSEYKEKIVDYMFDEYAAGRTPNPDVLCNREIKFDIFLKNALKLGADFVATGHYVQKTETTVDGVTTYHLLSGKDPGKDQSYFLCQLSQEQLSKSLFPIGSLLKSEVRAIAESAGLATATKKDSQGLCFIGKVSLPDFLQQQLKSKTGDVIEIAADNPKVVQHALQMQSSDRSECALVSPVFDAQDGKKIGEHKGAHFYTIGQRKGLNIGGHKEPLFVLQTDVKNNLIFLGAGENHPALYRRGLQLDENGVHWVNPSYTLADGESMEVMMRIRYRQDLFEAELIIQNGVAKVFFKQPQKSVTPGQFAAFYNENELIASGVIH